MSASAEMGLQIMATLRRARVARGISKSELARRLGISRSTFSQTHDGYHLPTFSLMVRWAAEVGVTIRAVDETGGAG